MIEITRSLAIPDDELRFVASRSSGPGGQHVNKTSTRVTLLFDVAGSPSLDERQRRLITENLASRITQDGVLRVVAQRERSQSMNRTLALERFVDLLRDALRPPKHRVATRPTRASKRRRVDEKKRRGRLKRERRRKDFD